MGFYQSETTFDLGEMSVENLFITDFMPSASGTYVKVYLMGLMLSKSSTDGLRMTQKGLASLLNLPIQDVLDAWVYWEKQGIVKLIKTDPGDEPDVAFISVRELYIQSNFTSKMEKPISKPNTKRQTPYKKLYDSVEKVIGQTLSYTLYRDIGDFYDNYYPDATIITKAFEITYKERNIRDIKAVRNLLNKWLELDLKDLTAIETYIKNTNTRYSMYKDVLKTLGIPYRLANEAEMECIDRWLDDYEFSLDTILDLIKAFALKTNSLNFNFLENRFKNLYDQGIKSYSDFTKLEGKDKNKSKPNTHKRNQHIVEKHRSYSEEELEALLLNKKE